MRRRRGSFRALALAASFGIALGAGRADGSDGPPTRRVAAGEGYRAGTLHRLVFGAHYRDLWAIPIEVEVLDLDAFAGGLTPEKRGGGQQTKALRFVSGDGRAWTFRSVDKDPSRVLPPELRETLVDEVVQDQISSAHPAGALVAARVAAAAGVLHAEPRLVVLPDAPRLGPFRAEFAGMLGMLEERPDESEAEADDPDGAETPAATPPPAFPRFQKVVSTEKLLARLAADAGERVDVPAYLTARLVDFVLGDWDRHEDQWRWARLKKKGAWLPIPRDRDQALSRFDGLLPSIARNYVPQIVSFGERYPAILGLAWNSRTLDRRLLAPLDRVAYEEAARRVVSTLPDAVLDEAVRAMPRPYADANGAWLAAALKKRRDALPEAARRFHRLLAAEVEVHGTEESDVASVAALPDGSVEVTLRTPSGRAFFTRRFDPRETREVRLFLGGGDDRVTVTGDVRGRLRLRVVGGDGRDVVDDAAGGGTHLYDADAGTAVTPGRGTRVDARPYAPPAKSAATIDPPRDWGSLVRTSPYLVAAPDLGVLVGGGVVWYRYGFRRDPHLFRQSLRAAYATGALSYRVDYSGDFRIFPSSARLSVDARASGLEVLRFHGFGNETEETLDRDFYVVEETRLTLRPALAFPLDGGAVLTAGPTLAYSKTELTDDRLVSRTRPYGSGLFRRVGLFADVAFDGRDEPANPTRGLHAALGASAYPALWDVEEAFGEVHAEASAAFSLKAPLSPVVAVRAAGKKVWGRYPFQESAFVGGRGSVRGFSEQRFAGDASAFGGAELRVSFGKFFLVLPGEIGAFALVDAGRVFLAGESSSTWHTSAGGGIWVAYLGRANTISVGVARSTERTGVYVQAGFGF